MLGVALLFGKETLVAGHDEAEVARASKVGPLIIDFQLTQATASGCFLKPNFLPR